MSLIGKTKGTRIEKDIDNLMELEAKAAVRYHALARVASEQGLDELADELKKIAVDEAEHAGLYAVLNGQIGKDLFTALNAISQGEIDAGGFVKAFAQDVRNLGIEDAATAIESIAADEMRHGENLKALAEKYLK